MRKTVWKNQVVKQALESLSLARSLVKKTPENPPVEKLATTINETAKESTNETKMETTDETKPKIETTNE
jgi:hypothetical protein